MSEVVFCGEDVVAEIHRLLEADAKLTDKEWLIRQIAYSVLGGYSLGAQARANPEVLQLIIAVSEEISDAYRARVRARTGGLS